MESHPHLAAFSPKVSQRLPQPHPPGRIEDELDDLLLPYTFSLLRHDTRTDSEVAEHIARVGVPFYQREAATALSA
jgi:hypothetical protein